MINNFIYDQSLLFFNHYNRLLTFLALWLISRNKYILFKDEEPMEHLDEEELLPVRTPTLILSRTRFITTTQFSVFSDFLVVSNSDFRTPGMEP